MGAARRLPTPMTASARPVCSVKFCMEAEESWPLSPMKC
jgi:hypothetical protein